MRINLLAEMLLSPRLRSRAAARVRPRRQRRALTFLKSMFCSYQPPPRTPAPRGRSWDDDPLNLTGKWGKKGRIEWIGGKFNGDYMWVPSDD